ncbi:cache domain-containing protein [Acinetobacter sp. MB5]|uniref:cache domain-containing protein n=1 Tax=Acinetobacter sp. MB5 TaxID=2069438 RepID=UPI000DD0DA68|nr:cache domain-containing protein [Acinetobacter sp. MB5]
MKDMQIEQIQNLLNQVVNEITQAAQDLAIEASQLLSADSVLTQGGVKLTETDRHQLQAHIQTALQKSQYSHGMGFASYSAATNQQQGYWTLEWWYKKDQKIQQAELESYQELQQRLDFRLFDWFNHPAKNKQPYVEGPYVDYICNHAYTITFSHPVMIDQQFVGVIVIDLLVSTLDQLVLPKLKTLEQTAVVTNDDARIILSNTSKYRTGALFKEKPPQKFSDSHHPFQVILVQSYC